ncbi:hypothetical protein PRZ48_011262 [Zasmidium cellare]|uniref:Major facilitator superfamily (MFS) profile domain-containing protein n=1 Tax=Zasmidium cellare TaxID=395010 RepID=A0ABR0EBM0_ZASCE|nr:hypothetical protein PRZ48_011262 [Zasmidium cellare]
MASWINYGLGVIPHQSVAWRLPLAIPAIFILVLLASIFLFPESPHWLTSKGRLQEARDVYSVLDDLPADSEAIRIKVAAVADSFEQHEDAKGWLRIVSRDQKSKTFYRACIAFFVNFNASMSGANGVTYYAQTIFTESLHFATREAAVLSASLLSWKIIVALIPLYVVDRFGRRQAAGDVAVLFLFLFFAFFPVAYLGANFLYATEIAPQELRVHFSAIGTATHWLFNFVVAEIVPTSFASIGYRTYIIFAVLSAFSVPLVILFFPETKGFALQDLDKIFESASHWYNVPRLAKQYLREANDPEIGGDGVSIGLEKDLDDGAKEVENVTKG